MKPMVLFIKPFYEVNGNTYNTGIF